MQNLKTQLKIIIERNDTRAGLAFDFFITALIVISIVTFTLETVPELYAQWLSYFEIIETVIVLIFSAEYLLRIYLADRKFAYIFSFYGLVDLFAILPYYLPTAVDLRSLRIMRILRLLKLFRYSRSVRRLKRAFAIAKEEMILSGAVAAMLMYLSAVGIYFFENQAQPEVFDSIFSGMWWAFVTLTTVGYGDAYPITFGGRLFTFMILVIGLIFVAIPSGLLASAMISVREEEREAEKTQQLLRNKRLKMSENRKV